MTAIARVAAAVAAAAGCILLAGFASETPALSPSRMPRLGAIDERFQSFNVEMVEVTGGRFWAPYHATAPKTAKPDNSRFTVGELDPSAFQMRPPIDLANHRLRALAAALGPLYIRVSGMWANSTYFHDSDAPPPAAVPAGFGGILTRAEWRGVLDFTRSVDARLITSFAISPGVRDAAGVWTPVEAQKIVAFTKSAGGHIAAAEMFNEPTFASLGGAPPNYDSAMYGRDFKRFLEFARKQAPGMLVLGPGSIGEAGNMGQHPSLKSVDMLAASGRGVDVFSYHFYGAVSQRCAGAGQQTQTTLEEALSSEWLARTDRDEAFYAALRDRFEPGKPMWLTETGEAACGGNPWAATFADTFRYLDQLGRLAKQGVQVVVHNTLAASDYAVIDDATLTPRPNYWAALAWRRLMGSTVLDPGLPPSPAIHMYAHCAPHIPGGVTVLAINTSREQALALAIPSPAERYTLTAAGLASATVQENGVELKLGSGDKLPEIKPQPVAAGSVMLAPASITFLVFRGAANAACR